MDYLAGKIIKCYELRALIGKGGFGAVYRAWQPTLGREVAIKIILPQYADHPDFIRRFEAEAQLVARLEHPYIVPLYDYWREPGGAYLVMRYLRGGSARAALARGPWSPDAAARLLDQVAAALSAAHRAGVIHRDIKPDNLLLDEDDNAYLADFGIAKTLSADVTRTEGMVGSPAYLSPEQLKSEAVTPQTDLYSLGIVLYELLTGQHPFPDVTPTTLIVKHLNEPLPPLAMVRPDLPVALDRVLQKATAKAPADRYPDAPALAAAFHAALAGQPAAPVFGDAATTPDLAPFVVMAASPEPANPYKGLRAFTEADADDFFGREALVRQLIARLGEEGDVARFLAVVGPSGSGKSSAVRAGLIPALRQGALPGSERWFVVAMLPGVHPLEELEAALLRVAVNPPASLLEQLRQDERGLLRAVKRALPSDDATELFLIVDQFEEIFTLVVDEAERRHFVESLYLAATEPRGRLRVVVTLRADFYDRPLLYPELGELVRQRTEVVLPLSPEELERAITGPASRAGVALEPGLTTAILDDVSAQPGALPLLQYALTDLFEQRQGGTLTLAAYRALGGVRGALARRAEALYAGLDAAGQEAARQLFLRLLTLGEGTEETRRRARQAEILSAAGDARVMEAVIDAFGRARLLTFDRDPATRAPTVEVAHEALLREWDRLHGWLEASREDVRVHRRLTAATGEWVSAGRDTSFLARGARLAGFEAWAETTSLALNAEERAYLAASRALREREQQEREAQRQQELRRLRIFVGVLAAAAIIALALAALAVDARQRADAHAAEARSQAAAAQTAQAGAEYQAGVSRSLALAAQAQLELQGRYPERAALLALEALENYPYTWQAERALASAVQNSRLRGVFLGHGNSLTEVAWSPTGTHVVTASEDGTVIVWDADTGEEEIALPSQGYFAAWSPDGARLVTDGGDGAVNVWDVRTGEAALTLAGHAGAVFGAAWSPDGTRIVTASLDGTARIWDATTGTEQLTLYADVGDWIQSVAWSPDGAYIVAVGGGGDARVWDAETGAIVLSFTGRSPTVHSVAWSPDGARIVTANGDGTATVWDAHTGAEVRTYAEDITGGANCAAWSPDGAYIVTAGANAVVWDVEAGAVRFTISGHAGGVRDVAWSPDGARIVTAGGDGTAKVWDADVSPELLALSGHIFRVLDAEWSPDAARIATASDDGTAKVWDAVSGAELLTLAGPPAGAVTGVAWSPDGTRVVTSGAETAVWDVAAGVKLLALVGHARGTVEAAWSPDGTRIATASADSTVKVWDAETGAALLTLGGHTSPVLSVAFSPDGAWIVTASYDGAAKVWDAATGTEWLTLAGHTSPVLGAAFSPDGTRVVTASSDGTAKVWDATTGVELLALAAHTGEAWSAAWSPDGARIVTAGQDAMVKVWDARTGAGLLTFSDHMNVVYSVAWSPDGTRILTGGLDGTAKVWRVWPTTRDLIDDARQCCAVRELTDEERAQFDLPR